MSYYLFRHLLLIIILCSVIGAGYGAYTEKIVHDPVPSEDLSLAPPEIQDAYQSWAPCQ